MDPIEEPHKIYECVIKDCPMESVCLFYAEHNTGMSSSTLCYVGHSISNLLQELDIVGGALLEDFGEVAPTIAFLMMLFNLSKEVAALGEEVKYLHHLARRPIQIVPFGPVGLGEIKPDDEDDGGNTIQ